MNLQNYTTLFLDRDGVINRRIVGDYVKQWEEFEFLPDSLEAISIFSHLFKHIFIVTNQQGVGKDLMRNIDLDDIHSKMVAAIKQAGGRIDRIYYCTDLATTTPNCRKPNLSMALSAKADFPDILLEKSIMVGDSVSDMEFGKNAGMVTVLIENKADIGYLKEELVDFSFPNLAELSSFLLSPN